MASPRHRFDWQALRRRYDIIITPAHALTACKWHRRRIARRKARLLLLLGSEGAEPPSSHARQMSR